MNSVRRAALSIVAIGSIAVAALWRLEGASPWWDEGWTLTVARTWVERGFYGRLLNGELAPPGLEAAFPTTSLVALSFRWFGVGLWQGRLPIVVCTLVALALFFWLARQLYDVRIAWATVFVALLTPVHPLLNPLLMGRQVMAEMPMLAFLLAGYVCFFQVLKSRRWWLLPAILFWGLGVRTKLQAVPFWTLSLFVPLVVCVFQRRWHMAKLLAIGLSGTVLITWLVPLGQAWLLAGRTAPPAALPDLFAVTAIVPRLDVRLFALKTTFTDGLLPFLGLAYAAWRFGWRDRWQLATPSAVVSCMWLVFAGSWFVWFASLSVGWERYLFPATFAASVFVAAFLAELTYNFDLQATLRQLAKSLQQRRLQRAGVAGLAAIMLIAATLPLAAETLYRAYILEPNQSAVQTAAFLNSSTAANTRIETYESELFFFLQRPYHFPPDEIHVALDRQMVLKQPMPTQYTPLAAQPDVVVIGSFSRMWKLYDALPSAPNFRLVRSFGMYDIYERIDH